MLHNGLGNDAGDGVDDAAGCGDVERGGEGRNVTEDMAGWVVGADQGVGDAEFGGEGGGLLVSFGVVVDAEDGDGGVGLLEVLEPREFLATRAAPRGPEVEDDDLVLGRDGWDEGTFEGVEGDLAELDGAWRDVDVASEEEVTGSGQKEGGGNPGGGFAGTGWESGDHSVEEAGPSALRMTSSYCLFAGDVCCSKVGS